MSVTPGLRLGPYEIVGALGAGGMGEVYRAKDTRLGRDVAIKVLPAAFARDPQRLARFEREARVLASLNHPNIAHVYGFESAADDEGATAHFLAMELVEGEDLAARLKRGPIPLADAVEIARQIAEGLESAHEKGIVHRDLKPANVKVASDGRAKVLDFGLAKAFPGDGSRSPVTTHSPTLPTSHRTEAGVILGTVPYMSPEQARAVPVDKRTDIWAFGVVLYEMLTGTQLFTGATLSDVLAAVLTQEPDWALLPPETPRGVREVLRRCIERDLKRRLHDIADARIGLETSPDVDSTSLNPKAAPPDVNLARKAAVPILVGIVAFAMGGLATRGSLPKDETAAAAISRLSILAPPNANLYPDSTQVALSPDGTMVAFVTGGPQAPTALWVRSLDSLTSRRLEGTESATQPFWSPDGRRLGFFTQDKLKTVPVAGGRAEALCDVPGNGGRGGAWAPSNVIVFARDASGPLYKVSANGGEVTKVTTVDTARGQAGHRFPTFLPDGDHFLYAALPGRAGKFEIFAGSLKDSSAVLIGSMESVPVYAEPGFLLYGRHNVLAAQPFDARALKTTGEAISLDDEPTSIFDVRSSFTAGHLVSVSATGGLAYYSSPPTTTTAVWIDASGKIAGSLKLPEGQYLEVRISPDGDHAVLQRSRSVTESSLWLADLKNGGAIPLSTGSGLNVTPVWSPDGSRVVFASDRDGPMDFFVKTVGDASPEQPLYRSPALFKNPEAWSRDGQWIIFNSLDPVTAQNLWLLPASGEAPPKPYLEGATRDFIGTPSPDGKWLTYVSDESGRFDVYMQSFPAPGKKQQISTVGAFLTWWAPDSRTLYLASADATFLWRSRMEDTGSGRMSAPQRVAPLPPNLIQMDAMPDRQRFLGLMNDRVGPGAVTVVQNWKAALKAKTAGS